MAERQEAGEKKGALINHKRIIILQIIKSGHHASDTTHKSDMTENISFHLWNSLLNFLEILHMEFSFEGSRNGQNEPLAPRFASPKPQLLAVLLHVLLIEAVRARVVVAPGASSLNTCWAALNTPPYQQLSVFLSLQAGLCWLLTQQIYFKD